MDKSTSGSGGEIKIRVKSASHRCEDITINCKLSHSIKQVKEIIKEHYPLHPETEEQRLIYAGQLLEDQQILNDIFSQSGQSSVGGGFTVHLACNSTFLRKANKAMNDEMKSNAETLAAAQSSSSTGAGCSGEPNRVPPTSTTGPAGTTTGVPQDILAMHSLYVQQMMHFMAQWGTGNIPNQGAWGPIQPTPTLQTGFNQFNNYQIPPNNFQQQYQQQPQFVPFQNMNMNNNAPVQEPQVHQAVVAPRVAGAAAALRNEDDDQHPRDLLDWMYTLSRLILILSVVYFYSNLTRFILVIIFTALVFVFQRRAGLREQEQAAAAAQRNREQAPVPAPAAQAPPAAPQENANLAEANAGTEPSTAAIDDLIPEAQAQQQAGEQAQRFHLLDISRTFLTTFFTSLIPEMHPN